MPVVYTGPQAPQTPNQGDIWINQTTNELQVFNGLKFVDPIQLSGIPAGNLTGTVLAANVVSSSLTSVGNPLTLGGSASQIIPGATSLSLRNNANNADNLIITDAGIMTGRNYFTLNTATGVTPFYTKAGASGTWQLGQNAGPGSSDGTFGLYSVTGATTVFQFASTGAMTFGQAATQIVPGATSLSLRNNANNADNLLITDAGLVTFRGKFSSYNGVLTAGWGVPAIQGEARVVGATTIPQTGATYTVGAADGSFIVSPNVLVTAAGGGTLAATVTIAYTDEGNTGRTITCPFVLAAGSTVTAITFAQGAVPYEGIPQHIRAKASTTITIASAGTVGGATYNIEGSIIQIA